MLTFISLINWEPVSLDPRTGEPWFRIASKNFILPPVFEKFGLERYNAAQTAKIDHVGIYSLSYLESIAIPCGIKI